MNDERSEERQRMELAELAYEDAPLRISLPETYPAGL